MTESNRRDERPNIIYILGDDHRAEQMGCMGHPVINTPHLDTLAREGVLFRNSFCTSPLCTPSRACHYLGQWERKHGINFNSETSLAPEAWEMSFPMLLKQQGYYTGWVGKNHIPAGKGGYYSDYFKNSFDYWYGNYGHSGFYPKEQAAWDGGYLYRNAGSDTQVEIFEEGVRNFLNPDKQFIDSCAEPLGPRDEDKPFCLCVTFNLPHANSTGFMQLRPSDDEIYKSLYRDRFADIPLPKTYIPYKEITEPKIPTHVYNGVYLPSYDYVREPQFLRERRVREYQTITGVDRFIGNLRSLLDTMGLADNTIIIFSTDHGIHHGEHGLGGKALLYEEDLRIPLIIYDPRLPQEVRGKTREEMVLVPDLAPTVMELTDADIPASMQGQSLVPLLRNETVEWREEFFAEQLMDIQNYPRSECVRTDEWKYIRYFKRTENPEERGPFRGTLDDYNKGLLSTLTGEEPIYEELYNLREDPYEEENRALDPLSSEILDDFRGKIVDMGWSVREDKQPPLTLPWIKYSEIRKKA
jgi:arylsulfatase A-like enzyme